MTAIPYRLAVLQALTAHMERLNPATDSRYTFDLTGKVFRGRPILGDEVAGVDELPIISFLESPRPDLSVYTDQWNGVRMDQWVLLMQGIGRDDVKNPTDPLYYLAAQVEMHLGRLIATKPGGMLRALYPDEHLLGGIIAGLEVAPPIVRPAEKGVSSKAFFYLPLRLQLVTDLAKPFAG